MQAELAQGMEHPSFQEGCPGGQGGPAERG